MCQPFLTECQDNMTPNPRQVNMTSRERSHGLWPLLALSILLAGCGTVPLPRADPAKMTASGAQLETDPRVCREIGKRGLEKGLVVAETRPDGSCTWTGIVY
jgi:hypothetical protein